MPAIARQNVAEAASASLLSASRMPTHHSAARIDAVILIRRTARPKKVRLRGFDSPAYSRTQYGLTWLAVFDGGPASERKILRRRSLGYFRTKRMLLLWNDRSGRRSQLITRQRPLIHI